MAHAALSSVYSFVAGYVQNRDVLRVSAQSDQLNDMRTPNTTLLKFVLSEGKKYAFHLRFYATRLVARQAPSLEVFAAGPDGRVNVGSAAGDKVETIGDDKVSPAVHGHIRDLRLLGDSLIAAGMGRQVYRRAGPGQWRPIHQGILQPPSLKEVRGFNAIHGRDDREMVAVGWYGEIYRYKDGSWTSEASPTNLILNDVHVTPEGVTYACGQRGTLLKNRGTGWELCTQDTTEEELRSLQWYGGGLYVAADEQLFRVDERDRFKEVRVTDAGSTFESLHASDGVLISVGPKDIWWTDDATRWHRLD